MNRTGIECLLRRAPQRRHRLPIRTARPLDRLPQLPPLRHELSLEPLDPEWRKRAVCKGKGKTPEDIRRWFPGPGGAHEGKFYCAVCPVRRECKNYADENEIEWGIWGGEIRHRLKRNP